MIAQPLRDGDGTILLVLVPKFWDDGVVEVSVGRPGQESVAVSRPIIGRIAVVPVPGPDTVTELRVIDAEDGSDVYVAIPGGSRLRVPIPQRLNRIAATSGFGLPQSVQVRTDGKTTCRFTVGGFFAPDAFVMDWNLFDQACAPVDGHLRLLIAEDSRYSTVAGVASSGAAVVRLHWRSGDVTDVPVAADEVPAFLDTSGHPPDRLVRAEALDGSGTVVGTARP